MVVSQHHDARNRLLASDARRSRRNHMWWSNWARATTPRQAGGSAHLHYRRADDRSFCYFGRERHRERRRPVSRCYRYRNRRRLSWGRCNLQPRRSSTGHHHGVTDLDAGCHRSDDRVWLSDHSHDNDGAYYGDSNADRPGRAAVSPSEAEG
jgi:hypothetical protein